MDAGDDEVTARVAHSDRDPGRVHWMELFFDLIFVALVGQLAVGLHEGASLLHLVAFLGLFATVWWSWVNLTFVVNIMTWLSQRQLASVMLGAMIIVGALAVAAPEATADRAWLFAAGNSAFRLLLLGLWVSTSWRAGGTASRVRVAAYNGGTALLWAVSIWVPDPWNFLLWGIAVAIEAGLIIASGSSWGYSMLSRLNTEHLSERFGLLVVIVLGESVLVTVLAVDGAWTLEAALTGALSLAVLAALAWSFFMFGTTAMTEGLKKLRAEGNISAIRDSVAFLPFMLVAGITMLSGALSRAITHPAEVLPFPLALSFWGGITLFFLTNSIISIQFGTPLRTVARWATPALTLAAIIAVLASVVTAIVLLACAAVALAITTLIGEGSWRARRGSAQRAETP